MPEKSIDSKLEQRIVSIAQAFVNQTELPGNSGFTDKEFERRMVDVGWVRGQAWCAYFAELVWKKAYEGNDFVTKMLDKCFSGSATETYRRFDTAVGFETSQTPVPGALVVWRLGNGWMGHAGIVEKILPSGSFTCIEGNSNNNGSREGVKVVIKTRRLNRQYQPSGLNLVGFVLPY